MKVHEIMTGHPRSIGPDTTLVEAAGLMRELDVGSLPVLDGEDLAGVITDRDIVVRGIADGLDPNHATASEVMSGGVEAISADEEVENAVRIMEQRQIRRLPVLDRAKRLVGIVSLGDVATSSNPAFGGAALRDVSEPKKATARRRRLSQQSEPMRMSAPSGQRVSRRQAGRRSAQSTSAGKRAHSRRTSANTRTKSAGTKRRK